MYFSRKSILTKGKKPLYAASRVLNASCGSATAVVARCWVHSTNKTSAILRSVKTHGLRRAYSTKAEGTSGGPPPDLPFYSGCQLSRIWQIADRLILGKLMNAWIQTPTKWYPLPLAVGALLLVAIQYRKKSKRARNEVVVDENGLEVIKLKGPWHVCYLSFDAFFPGLSCGF
jgi:phosphatidylserine decarboxylase